MRHRRTHANADPKGRTRPGPARGRPACACRRGLRGSGNPWTVAVRIAACCALFLAPSAPALAAPIFTPEQIIQWEPHSFQGVTDYRLVNRDGRSAVEATCRGGTASGLFLRQEIDLAGTPILEWEWRVDRTYSGIDESTRAGDDYPARIYVIDEAPLLLRWRTRALNYVWSSTSEQGADWPNAFAGQARMIAVADSGDAGRGWRTERRNLREDFRRHHGRDPARIHAIAVMTDCDNAGQETQAWYGNIRFLPE